MGSFGQPGRRRNQRQRRSNGIARDSGNPRRPRTSGNSGIDRRNGIDGSDRRYRLNGCSGNKRSGRSDWSSGSARAGCELHGSLGEFHYLSCRRCEGLRNRLELRCVRYETATASISAIDVAGPGTTWAAWPTGAAGTNGNDGAPGADGAPGPMGATGVTGATGDTGPAGSQGPTGPLGVRAMMAPMEPPELLGRKDRRSQPEALGSLGLYILSEHGHRKRIKLQRIGWYDRRGSGCRHRQFGGQLGDLEPGSQPERWHSLHQRGA